MRKIFKILIFTIILSCGHEKKLSPILYEVSSDIGKIYILGSIHSSDGSIFPLPDYIMNKFYKSEKFIMELIPIENNTLLNIEEENEENYFLKNNVSEDTYEMVLKLSENLSIPKNILTSLSPLKIISLLEEYELDKVGIKKEKSIESYLSYEANENGIKTDGFESYNKLLKKMNLTDSRENEERLKEYILNRNQIGEETKEILEYWKEGNEEKLTNKIQANYNKYPNFTRLLLNERNQRMLYKIEELLNSKHQVFIAVGLGHIIGERNIIEMLKEKGYFVHKITTK